MKLRARVAWLLFAGLARFAGAQVDTPPAPPAIQATASVPVAAEPASQQILVLLRLPPPHYRPDGSYGAAYGDGLGHSARRALAERLAAERGLSLLSDWPMPLLGVDCYVMAVPAQRSADAEAEALSHDARVRWAQPMHIYRAEQAESAGRADPLFALQPTAQAWHLAELHARSTGRDVRVAVVDSGVEASHPDLAGAVELQRNFVDGEAVAPERHGTAVAGIVAARGGNGIGIVGVAPASSVMALRACWQQPAGATVCSSLSLARAIHFAVDQDAAVINLSLSGPPDRLLDELIDAALARGVLVVAAVDPGLPDGGFPASHAGVIAVTDIAPAAPGRVLAPGHDVPSTVLDGRWALVSGSSFSAAQVSGLVALLRAAGAKGADAARLVPLPGGAIDACASLARAARAVACPSTLAGGLPNTVQP